jgi:trehalose 6-phosphate phosphatase
VALPPEMAPVAADPASSAVLLDFDGTLAEIVPRPELAAPAAGAAEAVAELAGRFGLVAVISGRPADEVAGLLGVDGVRYLGLYGLEAASLPSEVAARAVEAASGVAGAWVEDKGASVAVHYRQATDAARAHEELLRALRPVADASGLEAIEGKMVVELVPAGQPRKGGAVRLLLQEHRPRAAMYAGDDLADLEAFRELDAAAATALRAVRVAVAGREMPEALLEAADLVVAGPAGLVGLLRDLAAAAA